MSYKKLVETPADSVKRIADTLEGILVELKKLNEPLPEIIKLKRKSK